MPEYGLHKRQVKVTDRAIEIPTKIQFKLDSAQIDPVSHPLLDEVARAILDIPAIELVEVSGHADSQGPDTRNRTLTRDRATAVVKHLVGLGVAPSRLRAMGYSSYCPLDPAQTDAAYEKNRRVSFVIVVRSGKVIEPGWGGCAEAEKRGIAKPPTTPAPEPAAPTDAAHAPPGTDAATPPCKFQYPPRTERVKQAKIVRAFDPIGGKAATESPLPHFAKVEQLVCSVPSPSARHGDFSYKLGMHYLAASGMYPDDDPRALEYLQRSADLMAAGMAELKLIAETGQEPDKSDAQNALTGSASAMFQNFQRQVYLALGLWDEAAAVSGTKSSPTPTILLAQARQDAAVAPARFAQIVGLTKAYEDPSFVDCDESGFAAAYARLRAGQERSGQTMFENLLPKCRCNHVTPGMLELVPASIRQR
jgi:hypothetical protein